MKTDLSESYALGLDAADPLRSFRSRFHIPENTLYMDGNSLGLLSRDAEDSLLSALDDWKRLGIRGWLEGTPPWFSMAETLGEMAAPLVGADKDEVVAAGSTTVNIHALIGTFYKKSAGRRKILADALTFPSDLYALRAWIELQGGDAEDLVLVEAEENGFLSENTIVSQMNEDVILALFPSVLYRSGQLLDMERLTAAAHERGLIIGFDCSHSAGAIPHRLHDWGVDFAMWCGYKYMNGGPGSIAFLYVNRRHFSAVPALPGWFGNVKERQFDLIPEFQHEKSAGGWQISTPCILSAAPLLGAIRLALEAGIEEVRKKSLAQTNYLIGLADAMLCGPDFGFSIGTPRQDERRGGHVALKHREALRICEALKARGVVPDFRPQDIIRIAPASLYTGFHDIWKVVQHLKEILEHQEYERYSKERKPVS